MITTYFIYGIILVVVFAGIVVYFFTPKRKEQVEDPKYRMLDDDQ